MAAAIPPNFGGDRELAADPETAGLATALGDLSALFLQVQVIFTIAWKKQISGEPILTGVTSSPPTTDLFLTLLQALFQLPP